MKKILYSISLVSCLLFSWSSTIAGINNQGTAVGTIATQNANNVAITGGAVDGTTLGATTKSTVGATVLTVTSPAETATSSIGQTNKITCTINPSGSSIRQSFCSLFESDFTSSNNVTVGGYTAAAKTYLNLSGSGTHDKAVANYIQMDAAGGNISTLLGIEPSLAVIGASTTISDYVPFLCPNISGVTNIGNVTRRWCLVNQDASAPISNSSAYLGADGSSSIASVGFINSPSTGIYLSIAGAGIGYTVAGTPVFSTKSDRINLAASNILGWSSTSDPFVASDVLLVRDAAAILALKNGTTAQEFRVYGTTSSSKYSSLKHDGTNGIISASSGDITLPSNNLSITGTLTTTGNIIAPQGAVATPSIVFTGATTTGFSYISASTSTVYSQAGGGVVSFATDRFKLRSNALLAWTSTTDPTGTSDTILTRDAANVLAMKNSTTAQEFRVYGTTTGSKYLSLTHNGTDAILSSSSGRLSLTGTATNDSAATGTIGEFVTSTVASGSAVSLTTATSANITSISLTAGDWDIRAAIDYALTAATTTLFQSAISLTSATLSTQAGGSGLGTDPLSITPLITTLLSSTYIQDIKTTRLSVSGTTTVYLVANSTFSAGTMVGYGTISARRVR